LLELALPADARDHVPDELDEVFRRRSADHGSLRARLWYWQESLSFSWRFARERLRERAESRAEARAPLDRDETDRSLRPWISIAPPGNRRGRMRRTLEATARDIMHAVRRLLHAPGFTAVTVATLALAIGANTAIFSVVDAVLIDPLSLPDANRLVSIRVSAPGSELRGTYGVSPEFYVEYRDNADRLEGVGMFRTVQSTFRTPERVDRLFMTQLTPSVFQTLGVQPALGRLPNAEDDRTRAPVMLISHSLWTSWFNGDPGVIGRVFEASNAQRTVIGVMPPDFRFPSARHDVWIRAAIADERKIQTGQFNFNLVGRMRPGVTTDDLAAQLDTLARRLPERFGGSAGYARIVEKHRAVVQRLDDALVGRVAAPLWILLGTVGIVLLIACANVANLFVVRAESRSRDLAVRLALGASRSGLVRSHMAEALMLAALGGLGGVAVASAGVPLLVRAAPESIPNLDLVAINPTVLLFTAGVTVAAALGFGLAPAIRFSTPAATGDLRQAGGIGAPTRRAGRQALVVVQTASALVLLVGAGLLARSFFALNRVDPGYDTRDILTFQVAPANDAGLEDGPSFARFHTELMARLAAMPGVESLGVVQELPLDEGAGTARFAPERATPSDTGTPMPFTHTGGDYFTTMGIALVRGRLFEPGDHAAANEHAILSQSAAERLWPGEDPIGKRFRFATQTAWTWETVIGVVEDVRLEDFRQPSGDPLVYLPLVGPTPRSWAVGSPAYAVKSPRAGSMADDVRRIVREHAPGAPMYRVFTMEQLADRSMAQLSFTMIAIAAASGIALVLGAIGLYGVLSYLVAQRTREIAVRMALGAHAPALRRMVVLQGARMTVFGVAIGVGAALLLTRVLETFLFGVRPLDATTFLAVSGVMAAVAIAASYLPARRASSVDPLQALRAE
jgi:predicted permease